MSNLFPSNPLAGFVLDQSMSPGKEDEDSPRMPKSGRKSARAKKHSSRDALSLGGGSSKEGSKSKKDRSDSRKDSSRHKGHENGTDARMDARMDDSSLLLDLVTPSKSRSRTSSHNSSPRVSPRLESKEHRHGARGDASPRPSSRSMLPPMNGDESPPPPASVELRPSENPLLGGRAFEDMPSPSPARLAALREAGSASGDEGAHAESDVSSSSRSASDSRLPAGAGVERTTRRGSMVFRKNKVSKSSSAKLHSSVYSKKQINAAIRIQKWYRVWRLLSAVEVAIFYNKKRRNVLREILGTEESYLGALTVLVNQFQERLSPLLSETERENVFMGCKELLTVHGLFFSKLRLQVPTAANKDATAAYNGMAQLFVSFIPQFEEVYTKFLTNQDKSRRMMETMCQRNKLLVVEMDKITDRNGSQRGRQFFDSLMTSPMQRLPRYQLLLKEYQKNSNLLYNDQKDVADALHMIVEVTLVVNERKRDHDELHMREMLERNSSMEVLDYHAFENLTFAAMRNCSKCEKAIWGIKGSGVKCATCAQSFHLECKESIVGQRQCVTRKKLDFSTKKLTYLQEVSVIPFAAPSLHVASGATPVMSHPGPAQLGVAAVQAPMTASSASLTPSMRRGPAAKHVRRNKAVLCFFDDGLGIAHIRSDDTGAEKFDFMGDLPWGILDDASVLEQREQEEEFVFSVRARFQEWRFALPTKTEQEALVAKLNDARRVGAQRKRTATANQLPSIVKKDSVGGTGGSGASAFGGTGK